MGVTWVKGNPQSFVASAFKPTTQVMSDLDMDSIVKMASEAMQKRIGTVNTTKSGPGRVDTGLMLRSVKYRTEISNTKIVGEFGWLDNQEPYFLLQDDGFDHILAGKHIPGMMALADAGIEAREKFISRLAAIVRF